MNNRRRLYLFDKRFHSTEGLSAVEVLRHDFVEPNRLR
jgi:hypothetical protein